MSKSILVSIQQAVNAIQWKTPLQKQKALNLCASIFNLYRLNNQLYNNYQSLSTNYFAKVMTCKRDYAIKDKLVRAGILECDNKYSVVKHTAKGYRFNPQFFADINVYSTGQTFTYSSTNFFLTNFNYITFVPHQEPCFYYTTQKEYLQNYYYHNLSKLTFTGDIDTHINALAQIQEHNLSINQTITDQYVYITFNKERYRYSLPNALLLAQENNLDLIQYKDKCYIDEPTSFIEQKTKQLQITYCQSVFNINNRLFYCDRNDTNNRLDYNLTGLKKDLFNYLLFDGEKLEELDIANAQFAIAAHLNTTIDANFIDHAQRGSLYLYTCEALNLNKGIAEDTKSLKARGKALMFRVAFDKVKHDYEFEQVRKLFPKYMNWADSYKKQNGYKSFANLLQKTEAEIMIDGLLMHLIAKGYDVFTIHDALRVKESQAEDIKAIVDAYFASISFKCLVRNK